VRVIFTTATIRWIAIYHRGSRRTVSVSAELTR
jgi:hypothetical protein